MKINFAQAFECDASTLSMCLWKLARKRGRKKERREEKRTEEWKTANKTKPPECLLFFCLSKWKMSMKKISKNRDHICVRTYEPVFIYAYEK